MFISLSLRAIINLESLNDVESVGNLSRHRTAPIVIPSNGGYTIKYVPVISGESIGHAYQMFLVNISKDIGLPVGLYSSRGEFIKFSEDAYLRDEGINPPENVNDMRRFEVDVMLKDVVSDIGGFMYTGGLPVKRTSTFQVSYMVPALDSAIKAAAVEAQFHVRFLTSESQEGARLGQIPYNVEVGSALYTFTFNIDIDKIAIPSIIHGNKHSKEDELLSSKNKRVEASIRALALLIGSMNMGAKRSRFLPNAEIESIVISTSKKPFIVSSGNYSVYISKTIQRANDLNALFKDNIVEKIIYMSEKEPQVKLGDKSPQLIKALSVEEAINKIII
ncbi:MAG: type I-A CRISPR-associated protein Cas7/Csa2 [Thermoprotei archaeon]